MPCSLCNCATQYFEVIKDREYVQCIDCKAVLLSPENHLSPQAEKSRYILHNNDVNDPGYIHFVKPVIEQIKSDFSPSSNGLDFGCGTGPVITSELKKSGFQIKLYDPYFQPNKKVLDTTFDFIICCEVIEHFQNPYKEFELLYSILKPGGKLYCKTGIWSDTIDFQNWHYKDDKTHVIFYSIESLEWIRKNLNFSSLEIQDKFFIFTA
ncbi:class I SAM-dependent methyltransferase [Gramella sp. MAR_2010_147]|uniref:class I SAM-dependent methyltransferase n=1 Tax=Gramella sp. MAR_2010_147 TaxID=1250205 RepID=UPI00087A3956|nr:class I SAM-dependent methyltransferase [Gramella sp. MAR_2010_147]SDR96082.1 Methyltransferase domain-containing protein [Gramella sp. MAR_2010_147]